LDKEEIRDHIILAEEFRGGKNLLSNGFYRGCRFEGLLFDVSCS